MPICIEKNKYNIMFGLSILSTLFLFGFSAYAWSFLYDAETNRLNPSAAKTGRITAATLVFLALFFLTFIIIYFLTSQKKYIASESSSIYNNL